ncbi:uncharacterized protein G2W53_009050 [Senna tora]|uniref:Uncharacterized protein n=1 Tax=Senna tora TaxID=362788 RepID=A0A835C794_9FABA|nr:uncharacterized protein G2W53_009050 [Senna tora]
MARINKIQNRAASMGIPPNPIIV